jgi:hypothetical protein
MVGVTLLGSLLSSGCGPNKTASYIPSEETARSTLETALTAWQSGKLPPSLVQESSPAIQLVDTHHRPGHKLVAFTILGPTAGEAHRCFAVRLTFDNPREEIRARFVVVGIDPLWVLSYEDYEMIKHCERPWPANSPAWKNPLS